jgi:hypothetical protein
VRWVPRVTRLTTRTGAWQVTVGHPLVDEYLEFFTARARPNTRLAVAFDLKVFFSVVDKRQCGSQAPKSDGWRGGGSRGGGTQVRHFSTPVARCNRIQSTSSVATSVKVSTPMTRPNACKLACILSTFCSKS